MIIDLSWLKDYVEQGLVSKTLIAFIVLMGIAVAKPDVVDKSTVAMIAAFYFGGKAVQSGVSSQCKS
jgi:hypothetical protein